jgi:hypothetical protein
MAKPDNEAVTVPDLYVATVQKLLGLGDGLAIVLANHLLKSKEMIVVPDDISPILCHPESPLTEWLDGNEAGKIKTARYRTQIQIPRRFK